jgi:hypothetical protein
MNTKKSLEFVEVVDNKLVGEEPLETLVRIPFHQLLGLDFDKFLQHITVLAIGSEDSGNFKIDDLKIQLAGAVDSDVVFCVKGILRKFQVQTKKLPKLQKQPKKSTKKTSNPPKKKTVTKRGK